MNRAQRRAAAFQRGQRWDRNAIKSVTTAALEPILYHRQYNDEQASEITNLIRMAWYRLTTGDGTQADFDTVASASNQTLVRAKGIGALAVKVALRAQDALVAMKQRYQRIGKFGADAAALADVPPMLDLYYDIVRLSSAQQMINAAREAQARTLNRQAAA